MLDFLCLISGRKAMKHLFFTTIMGCWVGLFTNCGNNGVNLGSCPGVGTFEATVSGAVNANLSGFALFSHRTQEGCC